MTQTYSVNEIKELAVALNVAAEEMLQEGITCVLGEDGWDALEETLIEHPEWVIIGGWIKHCLSALKGNNDVQSRGT